jgi:hypothetical protein
MALMRFLGGLRVAESMQSVWRGKGPSLAVLGCEAYG